LSLERGEIVRHIVVRPDHQVTSTLKKPNHPIIFKPNQKVTITPRKFKVICHIVIDHILQGFPHQE
jgi:hypothetical protein